HKIYLDYAATTPVAEPVLAAMLPYFSEKFGNSSSVHRYGQQAEAALENARETLAKGLNCQPKEVIFTSCGSESDNLALRGAAFAARKERNARHILISPVEHDAVTRTAQQLARQHGFEVEYLPVDEHGMVSAEEVAARMRADTALVSVIYANNEIGTVNPVAEIGKICRDRGIPFHTDAVQAAGYLSVDVEALKVDMLSLGAHKFYGPKGVGALYVRQGTPIVPAQTGGGQEFGLRAGTHNTPYIVGMAEAFRLAVEERLARTEAVLHLRDHLVGRILEEIPDSRLTGHPTQRLPNHASFAFQGADGNALLMLLDNAGFACSSGSACKTGNPEPSDVLSALGLSDDWALGSLRVTLGSNTTTADIQAFIQTLPNLVSQVRQLGS
ncbi:MAG TPA: cysteine desulfurase family protein, partial [Anaerolineales bacterium]|nr:cysteine desulfurase family protein [Anaerolineales bacterium]